MIYGYSNYTDRLSSLYKYNYNSMKSAYSTANTAGVSGAASASKNEYVNSDAIKTLTSIRHNASVMKDSLSVVTQASTFQKMYVESSKAENVAVSSSSSPNSAYKDAQIEVKQTAAENVNQGSSLKSDEAFAGPAGTHQFEIEQNGQKHLFSVDVKSGDTNKAVQQRMAAAVNSRNLGFTASVSEGKDGNTASLSIRSANTGTDAKNDFKVSDSSGENLSGSLVAATGVGNRTQAARDAVYRVNGGAEKTSHKNNVDIGGGVSVTLKKASAEAVTISAKPDTKTSTDAVKNLVDSFNTLLSSAKGNSRLTGNLNGAYSAYSSILGKLGVTSKPDGTLAVDDDKLDKAASNGSLENFFTKLSSGSSGFTSRLSRVADNAERGGYGAARVSDSSRQSNPAYAQNISDSYKSSRNNYNYTDYMFGTSGGATLGALFNLYA